MFITTSSASERTAEVSALLGRMRPRSVTADAAVRMGQLQESIKSTKMADPRCSDYVPAADYTDPAPATSLRKLDATTTCRVRSPS